MGSKKRLLQALKARAFSNFHDELNSFSHARFLSTEDERNQNENGAWFGQILVTYYEKRLGSVLSR
jgi:hypothetical protein